MTGMKPVKAFAGIPHPDRHPGDGRDLLIRF
jgi:hypothetical protein